jgi:hypothetical protein
MPQASSYMQKRGRASNCHVYNRVSSCMIDEPCYCPLTDNAKSDCGMSACVIAGRFEPAVSWFSIMMTMMLTQPMVR